MAIGDPYVSRAEFKETMEISSTEEDAWIDRCLLGAARTLERRSGWPTFWKSPLETRTIDLVGRVRPVRTPNGQFTKVLLRDGIASAVGFAVQGSTSAVLLPEDSIADGTPADAIRFPIGASFGNYSSATVTAQFGWPEVPDDIYMAHQLQASRLYRRKSSPEGYAGSAEWGVTRIPALDPDVLAILKGGGYMRAGIG